MNRVMRPAPTAQVGVLPARHPEHRWGSLEAGSRIEVRAKDSVPSTARVDEVSEDGLLIWIIEDRTGRRKLLLREDDVALYRA